MKPVIGITCATLPAADMPGTMRYVVPRHYVECVVQAGGMPFLLPSVDPADAQDYVVRLDGVLVTGGHDVDPRIYGEEAHPKLGALDPPRDRFEIAMVWAATEAGKPLLAICRGAQVLNVALGGTLVQHVPDLVGDDVVHDQGPIDWSSLSHTIVFEPGTSLREIAGVERARVNSFHHQAVDRLGDGLVVNARSTDGVPEGVEHPDLAWCVGVQWHPERRPADDLTQRLFARFLGACRGVAVP